MLPPAWTMVLLHLLVSLILYVILERILSITGILKNINLEQAWRNQPTPNLPPWKAPGSHMVYGWKYLVHLDIPPMTGWHIKVECSGHQVPEVTHPSAIPTLGGLTSEFPWDQGFRPCVQATPLIWGYHSTIWFSSKRDIWGCSAQIWKGLNCV